MTLTLSGRNYVSSSWDISRALTITGIDGVTKDSVRRISDTEATVELEFNGDFDADATLTFTVGADAIAGYGGSRTLCTSRCLRRRRIGNCLNGVLINRGNAE